MQERLVGGPEQTVGRRKEIRGILLQGHILRSSFGRERGVVISVLDVNKVNLHTSLSLDTNDEGRALAGGNNLVWVVNRLDQQTVSSLKLLDYCLGQVGEADLRVLIINILGELGNALRIGVGFELEALRNEERLKLLVVGNDAIVNDTEFPGRVRSVAEKRSVQPINIVGGEVEKLCRWQLAECNEMS